MVPWFEKNPHVPGDDWGDVIVGGRHGVGVGCGDTGMRESVWCSIPGMAWHARHGERTEAGLVPRVDQLDVVAEGLEDEGARLGIVHARGDRVKHGLLRQPARGVGEGGGGVSEWVRGKGLERDHCSNRRLGGMQAEHWLCHMYADDCRVQ